MNYLLSLLVTFLLVSCHSADIDKPIKTVVQERLAKQFPPNLFTISKFSERGSYKTEDIKTKQRELILYYKATFKLNQDYQFADWNKPGAQSLTMLLGATASGIQGIKKEGNKKGDEIIVYGTVAYHLDNGKWVDHQLIGNYAKNSDKQHIVNEIDAVDTVTANSPRYKQSLSILGRIFKTLDSNNDKRILHSTQKELDKVLQKAQMYEDIKQGHTVFSTGPNQGNYQLVATVLNKKLQKKFHINTYPSSGSVENIELLRDGRATFAIAQSDIVSMAYNGTGIFKDSMPFKNLRAVGALFPEAIMIITAKSSNIKSIYDLKHKRIALGARGSGSHADALMLLKALHLGQNDFNNIFETPLATSLEMLKGGDVDAIFVTSSYPLMALKQLESSFDFSIISLNAKVRQLLTKIKGIKTMTIPAHTYKGQKHNIVTVGTHALIVTTSQVTNQEVTQLMTTLLQDGPTNNIFKSYLRLDNMRHNISIPLHSEAVKILK